MAPICLLIGYLLGVLISRKYHPTTKAEKIRTSIFAPLLIGLILCCFFAGMKSNGQNYMFGYYFGGYILFTIIPSIVTMITMLVKVEVIESTDEVPEEEPTAVNNDGINSNDSSDGVQIITPISDKTDINDLEKATDKASEQEESKAKCDKPQNDETEEKTKIIEFNKKEDAICHLIKITSNIESTVYLDCEKMGTVSDGQMIKISIPEGPYLIRCVSIFDEVIDYSFELKKDELFNFKFKDIKGKKRK